MLKAIIFDCDGVIADTEPIHFVAFARVLDECGITLTKEAYLAEYLALDDRRCIIKAFAAHGKTLDEARLLELITRKAGYVKPAIEDELQLLAGTADFIRRAAKSYPLAVASGALRREIEMILKQGGLAGFFRLIVSAEDVKRSKPFPDPFLKACEMLNESAADPILPGQCLVIEDSIHGIRAAHEAGMLCVGITSSYPRAQISEAELVVDSLDQLSLDAIAALFRN